MYAARRVHCVMAAATAYGLWQGLPDGNGAAMSRLAVRRVRLARHPGRCGRSFRRRLHHARAARWRRHRRRLDLRTGCARIGVAAATVCGHRAERSTDGDGAAMSRLAVRWVQRSRRCGRWRGRPGWRCRWRDRSGRRCIGQGGSAARGKLLRCGRCNGVDGSRCRHWAFGGRTALVGACREGGERYDERSKEDVVHGSDRFYERLLGRQDTIRPRSFHRR